MEGEHRLAEDARGFIPVLWGFLFIVLDFAINGFDLLPDFVGYLLIVWGLGRLVTWSPQFVTARVLAIVLAVVAFVMIFWTPREGAATGVGLVVGLLDLLMVWSLCGGIAAVAAPRGLTDLAARARTRRMLYLVLYVSAWGIGLVFVGHSVEAAAALVVVLIVFAIVVMLLLMGLMLRAARELGAAQGDVGEPLPMA